MKLNEINWLEIRESWMPFGKERGISIYINDLFSISARKQLNTPTTPSPWGYIFTISINKLD